MSSGTPRRVAEFLDHVGVDRRFDVRVSEVLLDLPDIDAVEEQMEAGVNLRIIQEILGHGSARTTQIYTHLTQEVRATLTDPLTHLVDGLC